MVEQHLSSQAIPTSSMVIENEKQSEEADTGMTAESELDEDSSYLPNECVLREIRCQLVEAVNVLKKFTERFKNKSLFPEIDTALHLQCVYKKPAMARPDILIKKIILPHPLLDKSKSTVCLIMKDLDRSKKARNDSNVDKQSMEWIDKLRREYGITQSVVHKVITRRQLQREYKEYGAKRHLVTAYDLFLVDSCVAHSVARFCGKDFHKAHKLPFIIKFGNASSVSRQMENTFRSMNLPLSPHRTRTSLRFGNLSQSSSDLVENAFAAVKGLFRYCPGYYLNVRSIYMQITSGGPTVPVYIDIGSKDSVRLPRPISESERPERQEILGELSTLPDGVEVAVRRDGNIRIINSKTKETFRDPIIYNEWEGDGDNLQIRSHPLSKRKTTKGNGQQITEDIDRKSENTEKSRSKSLLKSRKKRFRVSKANASVRTKMQRKVLRNKNRL